MHHLFPGVVLCRPGTTPSRPTVGTGRRSCLPAEFKKLSDLTKQAWRDLGLLFCAQKSLCKQEVAKQRAMLLASPWPGESRRVPVGSGEPLRMCWCQLLATLCCRVQEQLVQVRPRKTMWKELQLPWVTAASSALPNFLPQ